ncbi:phosphoesterase family-domain-containing protein [Syncephalastrum racemosum]|uniref:Phosphoesterase family-domain-containing protein n=1 Tax=Syncephalastrum racemosum TaxID=13706 RepID=A0A1X2HID8_SYNRA|nr:phosphoesterase family-domain-containing protein [Syncephalastrum racemosum]
MLCNSGPISYRNSTDEPENFIYDVDQQIYNVPYGTLPEMHAEPSMGGFVTNYVKYRGQARADEVMRGLNRSTLPVLYALAQEYAVFDHWFSSVPGSTFPNRNFLHAATAGGIVNNDFPKLGYPLKTTFENLDQHKIPYRIYSASPVPGTLLFRYFRDPTRVPGYDMSAFYQDCRNGSLKPYTYIEPAMFGVDQRLINDQHPHASEYYDLRRGELFYKQVYEAVRASPQWNEILMLLVWDEHGGFYDHIPPPTGVPNPDGITDPTFNFTRLGIRVPAVLISPYVPKGLVISDVHEHASVSSTMHQLWDTPYLTKRDAAAQSFEKYANLTTARADCPSTLPDPAWQYDSGYKQSLGKEDDQQEQSLH